MIDVTGVDMVKLVKKVYDLSRPQGLGMMHFEPGGLSDAEVKSLIRDDGTVDMDYIRGRACKFHVWIKDDRFVISDNWYDHTDAQHAELLQHVGFSKPESAEHGVSCNCDNCRTKHGIDNLDPVEDFKKALEPGGLKIVPLTPKKAKLGDKD